MLQTLVVLLGWTLVQWRWCLLQPVSADWDFTFTIKNLKIKLADFPNGDLSVHGMPTAKVSSEIVQQLPTAPKMQVPSVRQTQKCMRLINLELEGPPSTDTISTITNNENYHHEQWKDFYIIRTTPYYSILLHDCHCYCRCYCHCYCYCSNHHSSSSSYSFQVIKKNICAECMFKLVLLQKI